jgi:protein SCO1
MNPKQENFMSSDTNLALSAHRPPGPGDQGGASAGGNCSPPLRGPHAGYIPNILVHTHDNRKALFYEDLLLGKSVLIGCISSRNAGDCNILKTFTEVQSLLGEQLGESVFLYCITTDPEYDTPDVLQALADRCGARRGWLFLTGEPGPLNILRQRLFTHSGGHDCSMSLVRYGNEAAGLWGGLPARAGAASMVERLSWITARKTENDVARRKGPPLLDEEMREA